MSLSIKVLFAILILGFAGLFVLKKPDGTPIISMNKWIPDISTLTSNAQGFMGKIKNFKVSGTQTSETNEAINPEENTDPKIYRWKDSNGQWQFSDTSPTHKTAEAINVSGNLNKDLVATYVAPEESKEIPNTTDEASSTISPMTISPKEISKLMDDTNNIQQLMDDRAAKLKSY
jgi:hypothetical protein